MLFVDQERWPDSAAAAVCRAT